VCHGEGCRVECVGRARGEVVQGIVIYNRVALGFLQISLRVFYNTVVLGRFKSQKILPLVPVAHCWAQSVARREKRRVVARREGRRGE